MLLKLWRAWALPIGISLGMVFVLTGVLIGIVSLRVTRGQMSCIQTGMTKAEVVAILGRPHFRNKSDNGWYYWAWSKDGDPYFLGFDDDGYLVSFG